MPIDNSSRFPKPLAADLQELSEGMAIVINGDTAPKAIASGQYLFIKNHSTLATGGYHATAAIASGADITSSNVTADADGIVNGAFSTLSEQIAKQGTVDVSAGKTIQFNYGMRARTTAGTGVSFEVIPFPFVANNETYTVTGLSALTIANVGLLTPTVKIKNRDKIVLEWATSDTSNCASNTVGGYGTITFT